MTAGVPARGLAIPAVRMERADASAASGAVDGSDAALLPVAAPSALVLVLGSGRRSRRRVASAAHPGTRRTRPRALVGRGGGGLPRRLPRRGLRPPWPRRLAVGGRKPLRNRRPSARPRGLHRRARRPGLRDRALVRRPPRHDRRRPLPGALRAHRRDRGERGAHTPAARRDAGCTPRVDRAHARLRAADAARLSLGRSRGGAHAPGQSPPLARALTAPGPLRHARRGGLSRCRAARGGRPRVEVRQLGRCPTAGRAQAGGGGGDMGRGARPRVAPDRRGVAPARAPGPRGRGLLRRRAGARDRAGGALAAPRPDLARRRPDRALPAG